MRIALIHAVDVARPPVEEAFRRLWPEVDRVNLLDDSLSPDRARDRDLTPAMEGRIAALASYAFGLGSAGILYTCSAFGPAIEAVARGADRPVLKPNQAMFEAALQRGRRIGMVATFPPSVDSMEAEFRTEAAARGLEAEITTVIAEGAMEALKSGDGGRHDRLVAQAASTLPTVDALLLAHFSTSRAEAVVKQVVSIPVLTAPAAAVEALRRALN